MLAGGRVKAVGVWELALGNGYIEREQIEGGKIKRVDLGDVPLGRIK